MARADGQPSAVPYRRATQKAPSYLATQHRHETHLADYSALNRRGRTFEHPQLLSTGATDWCDQPPTDGELLEQRARHVLGCCGQKNPSERRVLRPALGTVAMTGTDVPQFQCTKTSPCLVEKRLDTLNGIHRDAQLREHRCLIARAGADLQHPLRQAALDQQLAHASDHIGLRDGLSVADGLRRIVVSATCQGFLYEEMPQYGPHYIEHPRILDTTVAQAGNQPVARALRSHSA